MTVMQEHKEIIMKELKIMPYWKIVFFEILCVERLWKVYERLAEGKEWDKRQLFRSILDHIQDVAESEGTIESSYLDICDENLIDPIKVGMDTIPNDVINAIGTLIDEMNKKVPNNVVYFININFEFLDNFIYWKYEMEINKESDEFVNNHSLIKLEIDRQMLFMNQMKSTDSKTELAAWCKENIGYSILENYWFS